MARATNLPRIAYPTVRRDLPLIANAYDYTQLVPGVSLGYCRRKKAGRFQVRVADGKGGEWFKIVGVADDYAEADGVHVLDWKQAQDRAIKIARGEDGISTAAPVTVDGMLTDYERDLKARSGTTTNATQIRHHMTPGLLAKFVSMLTDKDLRDWRNGLIEAGVKQPTVARICRSMRAALNLAAKGDPKRITNRHIWSGRNSVFSKRKGDDAPPRQFEDLSDETVFGLTDSAHALDWRFGVLCEVAAETGARLSQLARIMVRGLLLGPTPKLTIPPSNKGHANKRYKEVAVAISFELAAKLATLAAGRKGSEPLLIKADGTPWCAKQAGNKGEARYLFKIVLAEVKAARSLAQADAVEQITEGEQGSEVMYVFRHASICRQIVHNVPPNVIADNHDTSIGEIDRTQAHACRAAQAPAWRQRGRVAPYLARSLWPRAPTGMAATPAAEGFPARLEPVEGG